MAQLMWQFPTEGPGIFTDSSSRVRKCFAQLQQALPLNKFPKQLKLSLQWVCTDEWLARAVFWFRCESPTNQKQSFEPLSDILPRGSASEPWKRQPATDTCRLWTSPHRTCYSISRTSREKQTNRSETNGYIHNDEGYFSALAEFFLLFFSNLFFNCG